MTKYVAGFAFTCDRKGVLLVRKNKPDWQAGKLNAIGGKVKDAETFDKAMCREFLEETTLDYSLKDWESFCYLRHSNNRVMFYRAFNDIIINAPETNDVGEQLEFCAARRLPPNIINNLHWLIPLALDQDIDVKDPIKVRDMSTPWNT